MEGSRCFCIAAHFLCPFVCLQYLITAVAFAVCRHGHILMLLNCWTGEKHGYGIFCLKELLLAGLGIEFWWYDINCR